MKHSFFTCACILLVTMLAAQSNSSDEMAIKKVIQQQEDAWNKHDWESFSSYVTEDGILINPVGQFWKGRSEILANFKQLSACCLEPVSLKIDVKYTRFLSPDIAIVYAELTGVANKDYEVPFRQYKKGDTDYTWETQVYIKENNEWKIKSVQVTPINEIISPHNPADKN